MKVHYLSKGIICYKGNIIKIEQDLPSIMGKLPLILFKLLFFIY